MPNRFSNPFDQFLNSAGVPYAGGKLYFYATASSTPQATYNDPDLAAPHANSNPVVLDSAGRLPNAVWLQTLAYKVTFTDANGAQVWTADPVSTSDFTAFAKVQGYAGDPNGNVAGTAGSGSGVTQIPADVLYDRTNNAFYVCTTTGIAAAAVWTNLTAAITGALTLTGVITPTQLVANTNNWAPTSFSTAYTVRVTSNAAINLTGIAGGASGRQILLSNTGAFTITLVGNSALSSAANRLLLDADIPLLATEAIALSYDATSSGWRPMYPPQRGIATIASGSLSGSTVTLTAIPATFAYLVLHIAGGSCDTATRQPYVQVSTNNGSSYDSTAANYAGVWERAGTETSVGSAGVGSFPVPSALLASGDVAAASTFTGTLVLKGYQGGPHAAFESFYNDGANQSVAFGRYIGSVSAINALKILFNGSGSFDAGTYALYGVY